MRLLNPDFDVLRFSARVRAAPRRALLLDFDGTLAPFVADRRLARPYPGVREAIARIAQDGRTRLGIVSGRAVRDVRALLDASVEMWGSHGLEHLSADGTYGASALRAQTARLVAEASDWIASQGWERLLERKPFGLALHGRAAPEALAAAVPALLDRFGESARRSGLAVREFDGGLELRPAAGHKGDVVEGVFAEMGEGTPLAYLGDDATDEDAFGAVRGRGLGVLVGLEERPTRADAFLRPPYELLQFLGRWAGAESPRPLLDPGRG